MSAIAGSDAGLVVSVNLVDVYEAVRRLRKQAAGNAPRVAMALHGLQATLIADIRAQSDVLDGVVASNRLTAQLAAEALGDAARVRYAPYGVPVGGRAVSKVQSGGPPVFLRLLYAGRIEQAQKRVLDLPLILAALRDAGVDAGLSIAGGGPMEPELRAAFEQAHVAGAVNWLGDLDPPRLADAYRSHDALLVTSVWETGPIVAWEAMSHELPVVSSRYVGSGLEGALLDGETALLFEVGDIGGAVAAIARLRQPALRERIIGGGLDLIRTRYSREASVRAWHEALEAIAGMPRKPAVPIRLSRASGRLDRFLGVERAEDLRRLLGIGYVPDSPGAAWPHTDSPALDEAHFLAQAAAVDRGARHASV